MNVFWAISILNAKGTEAGFYAEAHAEIYVSQAGRLCGAESGKERRFPSELEASRYAAQHPRFSQMEWEVIRCTEGA